MTNGPAPEFYNANYCCFTAGTKIRTVSGEVEVEQLSKGDVLITVDGSHMPLKWIGHRHLNLTYGQQTQPIRISRGAFGVNLPSCDLIVSPEHAIYFEGTFIPAAALVNGTTIASVSMSSVTYYHIELAKHHVVFAEGLPAETFLDTGLNAGFFANSNVPTQLHVTQSTHAPRTARVRNWLKARISGLGTRAYKGLSHFGMSSLAQAALDFSLCAVKVMEGAYAPRASIGAAVERARQHIVASNASSEATVRRVA
jgi:hypothetical protein